jgi:hypothetical protein
MEIVGRKDSLPSFSTKHLCPFHNVTCPTPPSFRFEKRMIHFSVKDIVLGHRISRETPKSAAGEVRCCLGSDVTTFSNQDEDQKKKTVNTYEGSFTIIKRERREPVWAISPINKVINRSWSSRCSDKGIQSLCKVPPEDRGMR